MGMGSRLPSFLLHGWADHEIFGVSPSLGQAEAEGRVSGCQQRPRHGCRGGSGLVGGGVEGRFSTFVIQVDPPLSWALLRWKG